MVWLSIGNIAEPPNEMLLDDYPLRRPDQATSDHHGSVSNKKNHRQLLPPGEAADIEMVVYKNFGDAETNNNSSWFF